MTQQQKFENGDISAPEYYVFLRNLKKWCDDQMDEIHSEVCDEIEQYNKGERYHGFTWEKRNGGAVYDFEQDEEYREMNNKIKQRRKILTQAAKQDWGQFITDDGEVIPKVPIKNVKRDSIVFK